MSVKKNLKTGLYDVQCWYKDCFGNRKHTTKSGFTRKKDAEKWESEFLAKGREGDLTMGFVIKNYLEDLENQVKIGVIKESTAYNKRFYVEHYIEPYFKNMALADIKPVTIQNWMVELLPCDKYDSQRKSSRTIKAAKTILSNIFKFTNINYNYKDNPARIVKPPKPFTNDKRADTWTQEQYDTFYNALTTEGHKAFFNILWYTGLRKGEALGLLREDFIVSSYNGTPFYAVNVERNYIKFGREKARTTTTKTEESNRIVPIPKFLYDQVQHYCDICKTKPNERAFPFQPSGVSDRLKFLSQRLGLPHISLHIFRHTFASVNLAETKDAVLVASLLGHKDSTTLMKHYAHLLQDSKLTYIKSLEEKQKSVNQ